MQDIETLDKEILRLTKLRTECVKNAQLQENEEFLKLKWLKGKCFSFQENLGIYGYQEYALTMICPSEFAHIRLSVGGECIRGSSKQYFKNVMIRKDSESGCFIIYSSNAKLLAEFVREFNLKINPGCGFEDKLLLYNTIDNGR